jgi:hypothetical protein
MTELSVNRLSGGAGSASARFQHLQKEDNDEDQVSIHSCVGFAGSTAGI